jgi:hypothetical protein
MKKNPLNTTVQKPKIIIIYLANRLLSGSNEDKNVPMKFHYDCKYFQNVVKISETIGSALTRALPSPLAASDFKVFHFGIELDFETPISSIKSLTYADTFIHLVLQTIN